MPHFVVEFLCFKCNFAMVQYIFVFVFIKSNFAGVAVDMLTFAVVSLSPNQVRGFCVITAESSNVANSSDGQYLVYH